MQRILILAVAVCLTAIPAWNAQAAAEDPVSLGRNLVQHLGCLFCHGLGGREGIVNPNAERGYVPAWDEKEFIEKFSDPEDVIKVIRKGRFPDAIVGATSTPIPMPPWGNRLKDEEMNAIIAYMWDLRKTPLESHQQGGWGAEEARIAYEPAILVDREAMAAEAAAEEVHRHAPPMTGAGAQVTRGRALVEYLGCLHCHGVGDHPSMENPNAERKDVPVWDDAEFVRRYQVEDGVRYVIEKGRMPKKADGAEGTPVPMPPFGHLLTNDEMDAVIAYIWSLREAPVTAAREPHGEAHAH